MINKQITEVRKLLGPLNSRFYSQKLKDKYILPYTEKIVHRLIGKFKNKIKDIDPILLDVYNECEKIYKKESEYVPGIYNYKIQNSSEIVTNYYQEYFGDPVNENLYLYFDCKVIVLKILSDVLIQQKEHQRLLSLPEFS